MTASNPFVIGIIGDFSGRGGSPGLDERLAQKRFLEVDRDDFDALLRRLSPEARLGLPFCRRIGFSSWEDFHPDEIANRIPGLSTLLQARDAVDSPEQMRRLIAEAGMDTAIAGAETTEAPPSTVPEELSAGDLLDSIVACKPSDASVRLVRPSTDPQFDRVIREIAEASADRTDYAQQARWQTAIDVELAARMRAILHHPAFQRLEGAWRSLRDLVWNTECDGTLRIRTLDLAREDLIAELESADAAESTTLFRLTSDEHDTPGGEPCSLLVGDFTFQAEPDDFRILGYLARVAERFNVPLIAAAGPALVEAAETYAERWQKLRRTPGAKHLGLCCTRLLLRLPYGPETNPIERFEFDEEATGEQPEHYLWGNPAFGVARTVARAMALEGTAAAAREFPELTNLPIHVYPAQGEARHEGPTERLLTETEIKSLREAGLIPIAGIRGRDTALVTSFRSLTREALFTQR